MLDYAFTWLTDSEEEENMFGQMKLEQFPELVNKTQKAVSAWDGVNWKELVGASYKPIVYLGSQPVNGILHWFIAEQTIPYKFEIRHVIKMAILEKDGEYTFDDKTVFKII